MLSEPGAGGGRCLYGSPLQRASWASWRWGRGVSHGRYSGSRLLWVVYTCSPQVLHLLLLFEILKHDFLAPLQGQLVHPGGLQPFLTEAAVLTGQTPTHTHSGIVTADANIHRVRDESTRRR